MPPPTLSPPVTLDNCDQEPIHIPGAIQPHGALLAVEPSTLRVRQASANAQEVLGLARSPLGVSLESFLDPALTRMLRGLDTSRAWRRENPLPAVVSGREFDLIGHLSGGALVLEFEPRDLVPQGSYRDYAQDTRTSLGALQTAETVSELMKAAAQEIRRITGFDRVMVYQFDPDGHGQVVAEERLPSLEPFLGLHYPASDIPAQARRLYVLNWLRIITDVGYRPSPLLGVPETAGDPPLDMSFSVLRSVSPIHVEYLQNMGVAASMSVSLVQGNQLWGLIACHHYSPRFVPFPVRMTCELIGQTLSTLLMSRQSADAAARRTEVAERRLRLVERLKDEPYLATALQENAADLLGLVDAQGAVVLEDGRFISIGAAPPEEQVRAFAAWMAEQDRESVISDDLSHAEPRPPPLDSVCGIMAHGFPAKQGNLIAWLRPEMTRVVSWAGNPEKRYAEGPNGPRLSPRGSFALWSETVRDRSERWTDEQIESGRELRGTLQDLAMRKAAEMDQARDMLLGMVSHDLRNPLGAIALSAQLLGQSGDEALPERAIRATARIAASSDRMKRMIEDLLDYTRSRSGRMPLSPVPVALESLCRQLAEEIETAHPGTHIELSLAEGCTVECDPGRIAQVISNLLSNARHHGDPNHPIVLTLSCGEEEVQLRVENRGRAIPEALQGTLFEPFRQGESRAPRSRHSGLGLGLYIVKNLVDAHQCWIRVHSADGVTRFEVGLPRRFRGACPTLGDQVRGGEKLKRR